MILLKRYSLKMDFVLHSAALTEIYSEHYKHFENSEDMAMCA